MKFETEVKILWGRSWLGIGFYRIHVDENNWFTIYVIFITKYFSIGGHYGGGPKVENN